MEMFKDATVISFSLPVYAMLIILEIVWSRLHHRDAYSVRGTLANFSLAGLNVLLDVSLRGAWLLALTGVYRGRWFQWNNTWVYWVALLILQDLLFYFLHRVDHGCRIFWAVHVTHHSSAEFNLTVGIRPSVLQPLYRFAWFLPLALLGFRPEDILLMYSLTQLYGVLVHTQQVGRLGILEWILVTPSHHRVHHASNACYLDRNFGMLFIVWDRLFGTFQPETEPVRFGLRGQSSQTGHPLRTLVSEWRSMFRDVRQAATARHRWMQVFGPPGWGFRASGAQPLG